MRKKQEEDKEQKQEKEQTLLRELCGRDADLYAILSMYLYESPLAAISKTDLDILTEEGEKSGNFRPALDKAIFEGAQNPGERERYIKVIQDLASKTIHATEQQKETVEKQGLTDHAASLGRRIEDQKFMSERAEDILVVASKFYSEKFVELGEHTRREAREETRKETAREEKRTGEMEKAGREARKEARREMGRAERRKDEKEDKREERAAEERKEVREQDRKATEREEKRIGDLEGAGREARKEERRGN